MKALAELCNVLAESGSAPSAEGIDVLWRQCPAPGFTNRVPVQLTGRQFNGILLLARFVARTGGCHSTPDHFSLVLEFLRGVPFIAKEDAPFSSDEFDVYFEELIKYVAEISEACLAVSIDVSRVISGFIQQVTAESMQEGVTLSKENFPVVKALLSALSKQCPTLNAVDAERAGLSLLQQWIMPTRAAIASSPNDQSPNDASPLLFHTPENNDGSTRILHREPSIDEPFEIAMYTDENCTFHTPKSTPSKISPNGLGSLANGSTGSNGSLDKTNNESRGWRGLQASLEAEMLETLERQDLAIRLLGQILEQARHDEKLVAQLKAVTNGHLRNLVLLLKACTSPSILLIVAV